MKLFFTFVLSLGVGTLLVGCPSCSPEQAGAEEMPGRSHPAVSSVTLTVEGMSCPSCSVAVRTALKKLEGVKEARVSVAEKKAEVDYDPAKVTPEQIIEAVNKLGYKASPRPDSF